MQFKGGVIIIGSLLWEDTPERTKWRTLCLQMDKKMPVSVPIRYGRESSARNHTYTMIFSNHPSTQLGQAFLLEFKEEIKNYQVLEKQAFAMAKAEGIWKDNAPASINKDWGTVGLLINPEIDAKDKVNADLIREMWKQLYRTYQDGFKCSDYNINRDDPTLIDQNGFLNLPWTDEMNGFDFLLATPTVPRPHIILSSVEIANQMNAKNYWSYFMKNIEHNITTFQDDEILRLRESDSIPD